MINNRTMHKFSFIIGLMLVFVISGCGSDNGKAESNDGKINYSEELEYTITGIEPGAGTTITTEKVLEEYDNLSGWKLDQASTGAMITQLGEAIEDKEPIIITGWNPHWKFAMYPDLKYLDDPKGIYADEEVIKTLARKGLKEDKPNAYKLLDQFHWEVEDMEGIMLEAHESGQDIAKVAEKWVKENQDLVSEWTKGVKDVNGVEIELVSTPWDTERASANVAAEVLKSKGFDVTVTPVDVAVLFEAIANGDGDATLAAWLPVTHKKFYDEFKDQFVDLGVNLEGAKVGLVVPGYMDIDSIEDLKPAE